MSWERTRPRKRSLAIAFAVLATTALGVADSVKARSPEEWRIAIAVSSTTQPRLNIELKSSNPHQVWSFRNVYGAVIGLGERIQDFKGFNSNGVVVLAKKRAPGEFTTTEVQAVSYEVDLGESLKANQKSHVSWLDERAGLLMLADLLPQFNGTSTHVAVEIKVPDGWTMATNIKVSNSVFETGDSENAVFLIGRSIHQENFRLGSNHLLIASSGDWPFSPADIAKWATKLMEEYSQVTGLELRSDSAIMLLPLPGEFGADHWSAETRGKNIVLLLGSRATRSQLLARLGVVLTHEVFHFWVPGSLALSGDYDWFFEGFTLYQALCTALKVKLIDFREFLATIARVYDSYLSTVDADRLSLIDLSERRWTSSSALVYEKGMLVAFLYDLELRRVSSGRSSFVQIYPKLFSSDHSTQQANEVILDTLDHLIGLNEFSDHYIRKPVRVDLFAVLPTYGILIERDNFKTKLSIDKNVSGAKLGLLRALGYQK